MWISRKRIPGADFKGCQYCFLPPGVFTTARSSHRSQTRITPCLVVYLGGMGQNEGGLTALRLRVVGEWMGHQKLFPSGSSQSQCCCNSSHSSSSCFWSEESQGGKTPLPIHSPLPQPHPPLLALPPNICLPPKKNTSYKRITFYEDLPIKRHTFQNQYFMTQYVLLLFNSSLGFKTVVSLALKMKMTIHHTYLIPAFWGSQNSFITGVWECHFWWGLAFGEKH